MLLGSCPVLPVLQMLLLITLETGLWDQMDNGLVWLYLPMEVMELTRMLCLVSLAPPKMENIQLYKGSHSTIFKSKKSLILLQNSTKKDRLLLIYYDHLFSLLLLLSLSSSLLTFFIYYFFLFIIKFI